MAETLVDKKICESCGSEVRDGSAFCFSCGESVAVEPPPPAILKPGSAPFNGRRVAAQTERLDREPEPPPVTPPTGPLEAPVSKESFSETAPVTVHEVRKEKAAAGPGSKRAPRTRTQKPREIEWVERESSPTAFLIVALVLAALAGVLVAAAIYLR